MQHISDLRAVSINNSVRTCEGQTLPGVREIMFDIGSTKRWDRNYKIGLKAIKSEWHKHRDPIKAIKLEKSPPNMMRVVDIMKVFAPIDFVIVYLHSAKA